MQETVLKSNQTGLPILGLLPAMEHLSESISTVAEMVPGWDEVGTDGYVAVKVSEVAWSDFQQALQPWLERMQEMERQIACYGAERSPTGVYIKSE